MVVGSLEVRYAKFVFILERVLTLTSAIRLPTVTVETQDDLIVVS